MDSDQLLRALYKVFEEKGKPEILYAPVTLDYVDRDREWIQATFASKSRNDLSVGEAVQLIIEHALVNDQAFLYFLPRLASAVLAEDRWHESSLYSRIELVDDSLLTEEQRKYLKMLHETLVALEDERSKMT